MFFLSRAAQTAKRPVSMDDEPFVMCPYCEAPLDPAVLYDHVMQSHEAGPAAGHRHSCPVCVLFYGGDPAQLRVCFCVFSVANLLFRVCALLVFCA
jgi:hypothetical protein